MSGYGIVKSSYDLISHFDLIRDCHDIGIYDYVMINDNSINHL